MANDPPESDDETPRHWADRGTRDGLTGVWTRAAFDERLAAGLAAATNHRESLALLLIDVDRLGAFNAQYGRPAGDVALKTIAKRIASALTSPDVLARFADDEFAVLCRRPMNTYGVALAQALRGKIAGGAIDIPGSGDAFFFTVSIGVSLFPAAGIADASALVAAAGGALRQAKQNGRDRVCVANNPAEGE